MLAATSHYVPALRFNWLTRFYDSLMRVTLREEEFKSRLVGEAALRSRQRILDLGCGTATLTVMLKKACPEAYVLGLDGDPAILARARDKTAAQGVEVELREGLATDPPFDPESFDRVVSSLLFHHLLPVHKQRALTRVFALLKPGGELHVGDWGRPHNAVMRVAFLLVQALDGFATTTDSVRGLLPVYMREAGFAGVAETYRFATVFGSLCLYRAIKPR